MAEKTETGGNAVFVDIERSACTLTLAAGPRVIGICAVVRVGLWTTRGWRIRGEGKHAIGQVGNESRDYSPRRNHSSPHGPTCCGGWRRCCEGKGEMESLAFRTTLTNFEN